jgi:hypothetical protein
MLQRHPREKAPTTTVDLDAAMTDPRGLHERRTR